MHHGEGCWLPTSSIWPMSTTRCFAEIRKQPGFEDFLLPTFSARRLISISSEGPVVMFVQSNVSHALTISQAGVLVEALPKFSRNCCEQRYRDFKSSLEVRKKDPTRAQEILEGLLHLAAGCGGRASHLSYDEQGTVSIKAHSQQTIICPVFGG